MNPFAAAAVALAACVCLALQAVTSLALAPWTVPPAWMRFAPPAWREAAAHAIDGGFPASSGARIALVRSAIREGDFTTAERRIAALPPSADRSILSGKLLEARGDPAAAGAAYVSGGDSVDVAKIVDALEAQGRVGAAVALQLEALAHVPPGSDNASARADAWWRLGRLYQAAAYDLPIPSRGPLERKAAAAYERAASIAPLSAKFLLAAGNEHLNLDEPAAARVYFDRLIAQDPANRDAYLGLADAAILTGDLAAARANLEKARALGDDAKVRELESRLPR